MVTISAPLWCPGATPTLQRQLQISDGSSLEIFERGVVIERSDVQALEKLQGPKDWLDNSAGTLNPTCCYKGPPGPHVGI